MSRLTVLTIAVAMGITSFANAGYEIKIPLEHANGGTLPDGTIIIVGSNNGGGNGGGPTNPDVPLTPEEENAKTCLDNFTKLRAGLDDVHNQGRLTTVSIIEPFDLKPSTVGGFDSGDFKGKWCEVYIFTNEEYLAKASEAAIAFQDFAREEANVSNLHWNFSYPTNIKW